MQTPLASQWKGSQKSPLLYFSSAQLVRKLLDFTLKWFSQLLFSGEDTGVITPRPHPGKQPVGAGAATADAFPALDLGSQNKTLILRWLFHGK